MKIRERIECKISSTPGGFYQRGRKDIGHESLLPVLVTFYEAIETEVMILLQYAGLNPMGVKARRQVVPSKIFNKH